MSRPLFPSLAICCSCLFCACSVKSDRSECPCILTLELSGGDEAKATLYAWREGGNLESSFSVDCPGVGQVGIPRGSTGICIQSGLHKCSVRGSEVIVANGSEMDEIFCYSGSADASGESVRVEARLRKQYSHLHLTLGGSGLDSYPYLVEIKGNVCGFDLLTLEPVPGEFCVPVHPVLGEYHRVCLPRQSDESLTMVLSHRDGTKADNRLTQSTIPIGKYIVQAGFDWKEEDLQDIFIDVDYAQATVHISVVPWKEIRLPDGSSGWGL